MNDNHERLLAYKDLWDVSHKKLDELQGELQSSNNKTMSSVQVLLNLETTKLFDFRENAQFLFKADTARLDYLSRVCSVHDNTAATNSMDIEIGLYLFADGSPYLHEDDFEIDGPSKTTGKVDGLYDVLIGKDYPATLIHSGRAIKPWDNRANSEILSAERILKIAEAIRQLAVDQVEVIEHLE